MVGQNVNILLPSPYHDEQDTYIKRFLKTGINKIIGIEREVQARRKDGVEFPMELAVSVIEHDGNRFFTGIVRDITERKFTEMLIRDSAERF